MQIRKLTQLICAGLFVITPLYSFAKSPVATNQHLIFFGDSLVDTGNYPEPANVESPNLMNFNLYVPITNPINVNNDKFNTFLIHSLGTPDTHGKINGQAKAKFSANWPLYLTYQLNGKPLNTWYQSVQPTKDHTFTNINYAWASAVAGNNKGSIEPTGKCFHDNGDIFPDPCTTNTVLQNKNQYQQHTAQNPNFDKDTQYTYKDTQIPDLGQQVSFYLANGVKNNATLFIYIGANDIGHFLKANLLKVIFEPSFFFKMKLEQQMPLIAKHVKQAVSRLETAYYKADGENANFKIYILTLGHLSNLHEGYSYTHFTIFDIYHWWIPIISPRIKAAIDNAVDLYNQALKALVSSAGYTNLKIIDSGDYLDQLANSDDYKNSIKNGNACVNDAAYTTPSATGTNDCHYFDQKGNKVTYFNWNNAHYTSAVNKGLANYIYKLIS